MSTYQKLHTADKPPSQDHKDITNVHTPDMEDNTSSAPNSESTEDSKSTKKRKRESGYKRQKLRVVLVKFVPVSAILAIIAAGDLLKPPS